ncbi:hypothetical protein QU755_11305 [Pseudomonas wenzhouensis]|nr:hypothetical protein [Pseudomonas wenzhouensis]MDM9652060.1 hypothetical protein [Pseudomonas wenzhouensis]
MSMSPQQQSKCQAIIHSAAATAGAGNLIPVPGAGVAVDMVVMTAMSAGLASVFGGNINEQVARGMAVAALKNTMLKQPVKTLTKELSKLVPYLGLVVAPTLSAALVEAAGWTIAQDLAQRQPQLNAA